MLGKSFDEIGLAELEALVASGMPEGRRLEFKRDHYGRTDKAKQEFAADVSALANALGGYLLIGIEEKNGIACSLCGIQAENPDALLRAVLDSIRSSIEPQIINVRAKWVSLDGLTGVLIIQVGRSWSAPHRVTVSGDSRFFVRDENGKHPMSVSELRHAFLFASEIEDRIRRFRAERTRMISRDEGPLALDETSPKVLLHVVPQAAFTDEIHIEFDHNSSGIPPFNASGWSHMFSLDGLVSYTGAEGINGPVRAFSTFFRNGIVEIVGLAYARERDGRRFVALRGVEQDVIVCVRRALKELAGNSVPPPFYLMMSLLDINGLVAHIEDWGRSPSHPQRVDNITLPELTLDDVAVVQEPATLLKPIFDLMWNAFGQQGSPSYDRNGSYRPQ